MKGEVSSAARLALSKTQTGEEFLRNARLVMPAGKAQLTLRIDADVLAWFRAQGKGYQNRMNAVLRAYVATQREG